MSDFSEQVPMEPPEYGLVHDLEVSDQKVRDMETQLGVARKLAEEVMAFKSDYTPLEVLDLAEEFLKPDHQGSVKDARIRDAAPLLYEALDNLVKQEESDSGGEYLPEMRKVIDAATHALCFAKNGWQNPNPTSTDKRKPCGCGEKCIGEAIIDNKYCPCACHASAERTSTDE